MEFVKHESMNLKQNGEGYRGCWREEREGEML